MHQRIKILRANEIAMQDSKINLAEMLRLQEGRDQSNALGFEPHRQQQWRRRATVLTSSGQ